MLIDQNNQCLDNLKNKEGVENILLFKMIPKMDNCFADASNDLKSKQAIKALKSKIFENCAASMIGNRLMEIIVIRKVVEFMDDQSSCRQICNYVIAHIYERIYDKHKIKEEDVKEALAYINLEDKRDIFLRIDRAVAPIVGDLVTKFIQGSPKREIFPQSEGYIKAEYQPWLESHIGGTDDYRNIDSIIFPVLQKMNSIQQFEHPLNLQTQNSQHQQLTNEVEKYLLGMNYKTEMNYFYQQMKLAKPEYSKCQKDDKWEATCTLTTSLQDYNSVEYKASSMNINSKIAENDATRQVLLQVYVANPKVWEKYKQIKKKLGLST